MTVLELIDVTDRRHPIPVDPISKSFDDNHSDKSKIEIGGNIIDLHQIKQDIAFITSQDKEFVFHQLVSLKIFDIKLSKRVVNLSCLSGVFAI